MYRTFKKLVRAYGFDQNDDEDDDDDEDEDDEGRTIKSYSKRSYPGTI